tara:strand:- start:1034 stop:1786 length:753 start_codon:yes stop_codon:yes gene_type:complete
MAYNVLSGTTVTPQEFVPGDLIVENIVSGTYRGDGTDIENVPRVFNATNNAIITNVGGDANVLNCEANLTFDGSVLSVTGDITASAGISASYLEGDGSRLTGITAGGGGSGGGIFTQINSSQAFTTSSLNVGSNATPSQTLSVVGTSFLSGGVIHRRVAITSDTVVSTSDYYLGVDTSGGAVKLTLPSASAGTSGQTWVFKDEGGSSNQNNITISGSGSDLIDGQTMVLLQSPYASITLYCNGINKFFIT